MSKKKNLKKKHKNGAQLSRDVIVQVEKKQDIFLRPRSTF